MLGQESNFLLFGGGGGDTFGVADNDVAFVEADDDYVADINDAHRAWDPGPTHRIEAHYFRIFFLFIFLFL